MTPRGYKQLQDELKRLTTVERPKIVKEIEEARAHGDISENAEFHAAKDRQSHIETRIRQLEDQLARALIGKKEGDVVEVTAPGGTRELEILGVEYV
jgi:transcription elongation factor GreA